MENLQIAQLMGEIKRLLVEAPLPVGTCYLILKNLCNEIEPLYNEAVANDLEKIKASQEAEAVKNVEISNE